MITFQEWKEKATEAAKAQGQLPFLSFDWYKSETGAKEYQCVLLNPDRKFDHDEQTPLLETDDLAEACGFIYQYFKETGLEVAVWQERSQGYRDYYRPTKFARDHKGRFTKKV